MLMSTLSYSKFVRVVAIPILGQFRIGRLGQLWAGRCQVLHALLGNVDIRSLFRNQRGGVVEPPHRHDVQFLLTYHGKFYEKKNEILQVVSVESNCSSYE